MFFLIFSLLFVIWGTDEHSCQVSSIITKNKKNIGPKINYKGSQCNDSSTPLCRQIKTKQNMTLMNTVFQTVY